MLSIAAVSASPRFVTDDPAQNCLAIHQGNAAVRSDVVINFGGTLKMIRGPAKSLAENIKTALALTGSK